MRRSIAGCGALCALCLLPALASAQQPALDPALVEAVRSSLRSDLRNITSAQESHFGASSTYTLSLHELARFYAPSPRITVVLLTATNRGYSAIAIHEAVPGLVCAVFVGSSPPPLGSANQGEVVCNGP